MKCIVCVFCILLGVHACSDTVIDKDVPTPATDPADHNSAICYVLCDFSRSQDSESLKDIVNNGNAVFEAIHKRFVIRFLNINATQYERPFFEYVPAAVKLLQTPIEKKKRREFEKKMSDSLVKVLNQWSISANADKTCIIKAIDRVANDLASDPENKENTIRVIILSDMLEACSNDFGKINLEKPPYNKATMLLNRMTKPAFTFRGFKDLLISVTASSRRDIPNHDLLRNFWVQVFAKYDYPFNNPITPSLPSWIYNKN